MKIALLSIIKLVFIVFNFGVNGFSKKKWLDYNGEHTFNRPLDYFFHFHFVVLLLFPIYWFIVGNIKLIGPINAGLIYAIPLFLFFGVYCKSLYFYFKGTDLMYVKITNLILLVFMLLIHFTWFFSWASVPIYLDNLLKQILL